MSAHGVGDTAQAEQKLTGALTDLRAVAENYPTLRATENFQQLSRNLSELEDEIQASRRIYNSNVQSYNTDIQQFPASIIAKQGGFTDREFFEIDGAEREPVSVSFGKELSISKISSMTATTEATLWICDSCGFIYDPAIGDPDGGIPPGTAFEDIPKDWFCPVCGARTSDFRPLEPGEA